MPTAQLTRKIRAVLVITLPAFLASSAAAAPADPPDAGERVRAPEARPDAPRLRAHDYPGLLSEFRAADCVVLVKATASVGSPERDPETNTLVTMDVRGTVTEAYKGDPRAGDAIDIRVPYAELTRKQQRTGLLGHLYFADAPRAGQSAVFLLKRRGKGYEVLNVLAGHADVGRYVAASKLEGGEAALALAALFCDMSLGEVEQPLGGLGLLVEDLKLHHKDLDVRGAEFRALVKRHEANVARNLDAIRPLTGAGVPEAAIWLASHADEASRRRLVRGLLERFKEVSRDTKRLRARDDELRLANAGAPDGGDGEEAAGAPLPEPLELHEDCLTQLVRTIKLIVDPSWHSGIPKVPYSATITPRPPDAPELDPVVVIREARAFVKEPARGEP